jgi:uncharacterized delta-60 repeat protein
MKKLLLRSHLLLLCLLPLLLTACGGGKGPVTTPAPNPLPPGTVGPAGGTVTGTSGGQVVIPAGALAQNVTIAITQSSTGAPALPAGHVAVGSMFAFTPHGTSFSSPATVTIPFDPAQVPAGNTLHMMKTNAAQTGWEEVNGVTVSGNNASASVNGFSWIFMSRTPPPPDPVNPNDEPQRYYEFGAWGLDGNYRVLEGNFPRLANLEPGVPAGEFAESVEFGLLSFNPPGGDQIASGHIFSSEDGKVYFSGAEAPSGDLLNRDPDTTHFGGKSSLKQFQSYQKNAENATMEIVITAATTRVADFNSGGPRLAGCPWSGAPENTPEDCADLLSAHLEMTVQTKEGTGVDNDDDRETYSHLTGSMMLEHLGTTGPRFEVFRSLASERPPLPGTTSRYRTLFERDMFEMVTTVGLTEARLVRPLRVQIDLSRIPTCVDPDDPNDPNDSVNCPEFTLQTFVHAWAHNRRASETYAAAWLRDPLSLGGDVEVITTGLTPTNRPYLGEFMPEPDDEPSCGSGNNLDAGTLEFNTGRVRIMEFGAHKEKIFIVRTGGSNGELSATLTVHDGTAREGTHFASISRTVFFGDGDAVPRAVSIPTINNNTLDGNVRFTLELTASPACARLGDQTQVEVTLVDDEAREVINPNPSGSLDTTFGGDGLADSGSFGGEGTRMIMQPDGKFVIVGGSFVDFVLARFNNDGTLDTGFGGTGMITTDIAGGTGIEYARAVAAQPDGRLVVAGESSLPDGTRVVALARYHSDGSLDTSFSGDGKVLEAAAAGNAAAVAVQPDGKILVAGSIPVANNPNDFGDAMVARFNADGSLDSSFGSAGVHVFALTAGTDHLSNIVLLTDGSMIVSGEAGRQVPENQGGVARLDANGALVTTFGTGGKVALAGAHLGAGLAVQADGKVLLAGGTAGFPSNFALMRLNADGSADTSFGNGGAVTVNISGATSGLGDHALAVAVRNNGSIYVAGKSGSINANFAIARFTSAGVLDTTFSTDGFTVIDFSGQKDEAETILLQSDGRIVLGGVATTASNSGYGLARLNP